MTVLGNTSIRTKLSAAFGAALGLVVVVGLFGLLQLHSVNSVTKELREGWLPRIELLDQIKRSIAEQRILTARRSQTTNFRDLAAIARSMEVALQEFRVAQNAFQVLAGLAEEQALLADFVGHWSNYEEIVRKAFSLLENGEISAGLHDFNVTSLESFKVATESLDELIALSKRGSDAAAARAQGVYELALYLTIGVIVIAAFCTGAAIVWSRRNVSLPILQVSEAMRRLTAGDPSVAVAGDSGRGDEIGDLFAAAAGYRDTLIRSRDLAEIAERERERLHAAVSNMPIGLCMFNADQQLIICNSRYAEIYALAPELTEPGTELTAILRARSDSGTTGDADADTYIERVLGLVRAGVPASSVVELRNGHVLSVRHQPMEGGGWVATHEDVTERRQAEALIQHMARHDSLTDLPNRVFFKDTVEGALKRLARGESVAVLCLDLDRFKAVNDTLGHPAGDALLNQVAARLRAVVREGDAVARFGGDEFAIIQVGGEQPQSATALAQRLVDTLSEPYDLDGHQVVIGTSIGIAVAPIDGENADQLLKNGDMALYRAKGDGRGIYRFFEPEMDARMQARRALELDLRKALAQGEFELFYQPVMNLQEDKVTSFEALLRWHHPQRGLVSPVEFIPLAEEIGLIVAIGEWVLRQACHDAVAWPDHVNVAVNLSPAQFKSKRLLEMVMTALALSKLPAGRLELEITEGVLLVETEVTLGLLHQLRALGVRIAMDDFGTGYSSLSYLRSFPFDKIKIDSSFIRNISDEKGSLAIIRAVTGLSTSMGMLTTAEGVETKEQLERVRAEGCTEVQGFLFSPARPIGEVAGLLESLGKRAAAAQTVSSIRRTGEAA